MLDQSIIWVGLLGDEEIRQSGSHGNRVKEAPLLSMLGKTKGRKGDLSPARSANRKRNDLGAGWDYRGVSIDSLLEKKFLPVRGRGGEDLKREKRCYSRSTNADPTVTLSERRKNRRPSLNLFYFKGKESLGLGREGYVDSAFFLKKAQRKGEAGRKRCSKSGYESKEKSLRNAKKNVSEGGELQMSLEKHV